MKPNVFKPWIGGLDVYRAGKTVEGLVKLASNENNYGPGPRVVEAIAGWAPKAFKYPYMEREVCEAVAGYVGVGPGNVVAGNGSDELIDFVLKVFRGPFAGFYPSYSEYRLMTGVLGEKYLDVKLGDGFVFDADRFIRGAAKARVCFLCSPNNPTGGVIGREDVIKVLDSGKITVVDEAYVEFGGESVVDLVGEYENLIVLRTFAKAFGLAGLRTGYIVACERVVDSVKKVKPPFNVNILAQAAVVAALEDAEYMRECVRKIRRDRALLYKALGGRFRVFPSEANFVLADVSPRTADGFYGDMIKAGFIVRVFGKFRGFGGEYVRVSVGTEDENMGFIKALGGV